MSINTEKRSHINNLRSFAIFGIGFFLITVLLTALIIVPKINELFETQHAEDIQVELSFEAELFSRFLDTQITGLQDLARFPSLANAAMLSNARSPVLIDIFDNVVIQGDAGRVVLQDIAGTVLIRSTHLLQGKYEEGQEWSEWIINGDIPYHFHLLSQNEDKVTFQLSIPVKYNGYIEGILSAEITVPLNQIFVSLSFNQHAAFKLVQDHITVATNSRYIEIAREATLKLETPNLTFIYVTDDAVVYSKERELRNTILWVLLIGFAISFLLFVLYGYQRLRSIGRSENIPFSFGAAYAIPLGTLIIGVSVSVLAFLIILSMQEASITKDQITNSKSRALAIGDYFKKILK
jgi:hypothetical protein